MASICDKISQNITLDCDNPVVGGSESGLNVFNLDDWKSATITYDANNPLVVTNITFPSGVTGFKVEGNVNTLRPSTEFSRNEGRPSYKHIVNYQVANDTPEANLQVKRLMAGQFVAIVFNNNGTIKIYGANTGLQMPDQLAQDYYAVNSAFTLALTSSDETLEAQPPLTYRGSASPYDFATAKAEIEALIAV